MTKPRLDDLNLGISLIYKKSGKMHVFTSPDMPELYIIHHDLSKAKETLYRAVDILRTRNGK